MSVRWALKCEERTFQDSSKLNSQYLVNIFSILLLVFVQHQLVFHFKFSTTYPHSISFHLLRGFRFSSISGPLRFFWVLWALAIPSEMSAQGFGYWLQWQVGLCAVIIAGPSLVALKYVNNSKQEPLNSVDLWKTCWKSVDPIWLLFYRACAFLCLTKMLYDFFAIFPMFTLVFYTQ